MKEQDIIFENYNYIMFVDASGDDGFNFKERSCDGSSFTFVSSCFVVKPEDILHNESVLTEMKTALNIAPEKELKSTTLKRHRFANDAYEKIAHLKGQCFSMVAFKKDLIGMPKYEEYCNVKTKRLSGITQAFPYYAIHRSNFFKSDDKILIVMDNMKKSEMNVVQQFLNEFEIDPAISNNYTLIFRDSKAARYTLIQIADVMSGILREYFESHLQRTSLNHFCRICKKNEICKRTSKKKLLNAEIIESKYVVPFLMHNSPFLNIIMCIGIITFPFEYYRFYKYIDCKLNNKKRS